MNNENAIVPTKTNESFELFKKGVDDLLEKRSYFISQVLPKLKENQDYYVKKYNLRAVPTAIINGKRFVGLDNILKKLGG